MKENGHFGQFIKAKWVKRPLLEYTHNVSGEVFQVSGGKDQIMFLFSLSLCAQNNWSVVVLQIQFGTGHGYTTTSLLILPSKFISTTEHLRQLLSVLMYSEINYDFSLSLFFCWWECLNAFLSLVQQNMPQSKLRYLFLSDVIFIMLLITIRKIHTHVIDKSFNMVEQGERIRGKLGAEFVVGSPQERHSGKYCNTNITCIEEAECGSHQHWSLQ